MSSRRTRVLVVHRDQYLAERLRAQIGQVDHVDATFVQGSEGAPVVADDALDVIVLDLSAAAPPGFEVFRILHSRSGAPPVVLLRRQLEKRGRAAGHSPALDGFQALEARLHRALGRSVHLSWLPVHYQDAHLRADLPHTCVFVEGRAVEISQREGELLGLLLAQVNRVVLRDVIIGEIWGYETRSLDVYVRRLRRKLGAAGRQIETVAGFGYRFVEAKKPLPAEGPTADPVVARS